MTDANYPPQPPYYPPAPKHPQATAVLILGILGVVACQLLGPIAWFMGAKARKEIAANPTAYSGESEVQAGFIMGIVGTCILVLSLLVLIGIFVVVVIIGASAGFAEFEDSGYGSLLSLF